jgi:hypothetical protein
VSSRKARKAAADRPARGSHAISTAGRLLDRGAYTTSLLGVYDGQRCLGFLLPRNREGVEAFDVNTKSLGLYPTQAAAADAIFKVAS